MTTVFNDKVAFIHIPKCGGTSVGQWLMDSMLDMTKTTDLGWIGHIPAHDLPVVADRPLDSFELVVATIRNPYAQQVSQYEFWRYKAIGMDVSKIHQSYRAALEMSFEEFVQTDHAQYRYINNNDCWNVINPRQCGGVYKWWLTDNGQTLPDNLRIVKLDEADAVLPELLAPYVKRDIPMPHKNKTKHKSWRSYYTPEIAATVERSFQWAFSTCYKREAFYAQAV